MFLLPDLQVSRGSASFFAAMRSTAQREGVPVGALLGRVLPFTEETSSRDQSKVEIRAGQQGEDLASPEMKALRASAVEIRSMIRVKMADENDFKQVGNCVHISAFAFCDFLLFKDKEYYSLLNVKVLANSVFCVMCCARRRT